MSMRFTSQLFIDNLPDEQRNDRFEVIMPNMRDLKPNANFVATENNTAEARMKIEEESIPSYDPIVEEITFPMRSFMTETRRLRTGWLNLVKDIDNLSEVNITFFCSQDMMIQRYLDTWKKLIFNEAGEFYYSSQRYKKNITVLIYGPNSAMDAIPGSELLSSAGNSWYFTKYTLCGCFPKSQDTYKLEYSDEPKRLKLMATFCVDKIICDYDKSGQGPVATLLSNPTALVGKVLSGIGGTRTSESAYSMKDTYK